MKEDTSNLKTEALHWIEAYCIAQNKEREKMLTEGSLKKISSDKVALINQFLINKPNDENYLKLKDVYLHLACQRARDSFRKQAIKRGMVNSDLSSVDDFLQHKYSLDDLKSKLERWDIDKKGSFSQFFTKYELKQFAIYVKEAKTERLSDIILKDLTYRYEHENTNLDEIERFSSIFYLILLCIDEQPHKKLILIHSMMFNLTKDQRKNQNKNNKRNKSIGWEPWLITNLHKSLRVIGREIVDQDIDKEFQSIYSAFFDQHILNLRTSKLYLSEDYVRLRAVVGEATIGEILVKFFLLKYYNEQEEFDYQRAIALLSTWKKRIIEQIKSVFYDKQQSEKLKQFIGEYSYDR